MSSTPSIDPLVLLAELRALAETAPDFDQFIASSRSHHEWLGKLHALIRPFNALDAQKVAFASEMLGMSVVRDLYLSQIMSTLHRTIADLEHQVPNQPTQVFGPGAVYDFYKNLREVLSTAQTTIFVIDPYLDETIFDTYISPISASVQIRLLGSKHSKGLKPAVEKFRAQSKMAVEIKSAQSIHDRVIFLDGRTCWVLGQSINHAAKSKPTYLAPLSPDAAQLKLAHYEQIWSTASHLT